jgi:hypothetical protein
MVYRVGCTVLGVLATAARSEGASMAEVLVLRQENAVRRRQVARVRYESADRAWFAELSALVMRCSPASPAPSQDSRSRTKSGSAGVGQPVMENGWP